MLNHLQKTSPRPPVNYIATVLTSPHEKTCFSRMCNVVSHNIQKLVIDNEVVRKLILKNHTSLPLLELNTIQNYRTKIFWKKHLHKIKIKISIYIQGWFLWGSFVTSLGYQGGEEFSDRDPNFFNYVQHIFPDGTKNFSLLYIVRENAIF